MTGRNLIPWASAVLALACGPSSGGHESHSGGGTSMASTSSGGSQGPGASKTGPPASSSTYGSSSSDDASTGLSVDPDCADVHAGDLYIDATTDVDALRLMGRVNGLLVVEDMNDGDLEFLACLRVVEESL